MLAVMGSYNRGTLTTAINNPVSMSYSSYSQWQTKGAGAPGIRSPNEVGNFSKPVLYAIKVMLQTQVRDLLVQKLHDWLKPQHL